VEYGGGICDIMPFEGIKKATGGVAWICLIKNLKI